MRWVEDPLAAWAASGAMALTGRADGPPLGPPRGFVERARHLQDALDGASRTVGRSLDLDVLSLLGERAALAGLSRGGDRSCGRASRLLPTGTGWLAVSLARPSDVDLLPAWLQRDIPADASWTAVAAAVADGDAVELAADAQLLGIPVAALPSTADPACHATVPPRDCGPVLDMLPVRATRVADAAPASVADLLVVDLSSLWAGPLCAHILSEAGAEVVKVESTRRPDGARLGPAAFFDLLHAGHRSVALDFSTRDGRDALGALIQAADVVIEASRPRALQQLGIDCEALLAAGRPSIWVSITGYGRGPTEAHKVAFGDDAAVAGALVVWDAAGPCFCADAIADPLAGVVAATAALAAVQAGGRWLVDVALARVAGHFASETIGSARPAVAAAADGAVAVGQCRIPVARPRARSPRGSAAPLGADTAEVLAAIRNRS